jgi:DNA-binding NarL/FixJ family response regulator
MVNLAEQQIIGLQTGPAQRRILLVDDHPLICQGVAQLIGQHPDLVVCGEAGSAEQALERAQVLRPDLVVVDVTLPGKPGFELIKDLTAILPEVAILVFSMHDERVYAERTLRAGARGYLMKSARGEELIKAIRQVLAGKVYLSQEMSASILDDLSGILHRPAGVLSGLSDREFEVFQLVGDGLPTREIGLRLHISGKTVEAHRLRIREKLGLKSPSELTKYALRWVASQNLF